MQVILSHANHLYLDHPYERDSSEPGLYWAADQVDTRAVFGYHLPPTSNATGLLPLLQRRLCAGLYGEKRPCTGLRRPDNIVGQSVPYS